MKLFKNIITSYKHIPYTIKHYIAFMKVQKQLFGYYKYKFHDVDKLFMYIFLPFLSKETINFYHHINNKHHLTLKLDGYKFYKTSNYIDSYEAIVDWECARYTKKDKPLNAYETLIKYYPEYIEEFKPYLIELKLWRK